MLSDFQELAKARVLLWLDHVRVWMSRSARGLLRLFTLALALCWTGLSLAAQGPIAVDLPGLGPTLLVGNDARHAVERYVDGVRRRHVFRRSVTRLSRWKTSFSPGGTTVASLRRSAEGRPVVGILLNHQDDLVGGAEQQRDRRQYAEAVKKAGGVPVFLAPGLSSRDAKTMLSSIDHLILTGGDDIHPRLYGRSVTWSRGINLARDRSERSLIKLALKMGLGIDGVCRGEQLLNVTLGGTMTQDIHKEHVATRVHSGGDAGPVLHQVVIDPSSALGKTVGKSRIMMKSWHHQAVKKLGRSVKVVGRSLDGVPEAIEARGGQVHGYQFHPEKSAGVVSQAIFADIVGRARARARRLGLGR